MNHWPFIFAAYAIVLIGTAAVLANSYYLMRGTEAKADKLRKDR